MLHRYIFCFVLLVASNLVGGITDKNDAHFEAFKQKVAQEKGTKSDNQGAVLNMPTVMQSLNGFGIAVAAALMVNGSKADIKTGDRITRIMINTLRVSTPFIGALVRPNHNPTASREEKVYFYGSNLLCGLICVAVSPEAFDDNALNFSLVTIMAAVNIGNIIYYGFCGPTEKSDRVDDEKI